MRTVNKIKLAKEQTIYENEQLVYANLRLTMVTRQIELPTLPC